MPNILALLADNSRNNSAVPQSGVVRKREMIHLNPTKILSNNHAADEARKERLSRLPAPIQKVLSFRYDLLPCQRDRMG